MAGHWKNYVKKILMERDTECPRGLSKL